MGIIFGIFIVLIIIVIASIMWFIGAQNTLVKLDENINNAASQIEVNLTSRFDALTGLLDLVKGYNEHEYKTLTDTIAMRTIGHTSQDLKENDKLATQVSKQIIATAEAYPELKANDNYKNLMNSLNEYENKVRTTRMVYNDSVTKLNRMIRQIPYNYIAPRVGIIERDYLEVDKTKTEMPSMKHNMPKMA